MAGADATPNKIIKSLGFVANHDKVTTPLWNSFLQMNAFDEITNQMVILEKYETAFGIQEPDKPFPISLVTMSESSDIYTNSLMEKTIYKLQKYKVPEITNTSLEDLLNLPTYKLLMVFRSIAQIRHEENTKDKDLNKLDKQLR